MNRTLRLTLIIVLFFTAINTSFAIPPVANFSSATSSCSGIVPFTDLSSNNPTSWIWDFGDGNTSATQNPIHGYASSGIYTVELIACNAFGCDTLLINNHITVNILAPTPIVACIPNSLNFCCGFGITNVTFNTINNNSNDGADGYSDFTCSQTTVLEGQTYTLSIQSSAASTQNYAAWIDFNNNGVLDDVTERVFTASSQMNTSAAITIPSGAVLNTPLRLRVAADFDFSAPPTPCADLDRGQAEDYTVIINVNNNPATPVFTASPTTTCDGVVCFTDQSLNVPTGWLWDFGDGTNSFLQSPCHTYSSNGTYTVSLTATNTSGGSIDSIVNYITVNTSGQLPAASCAPATTAYCCGYGIYQVDFNTISNTTSDAIDGYQDYSCENTATVTEGLNYTLTVQTGINNSQDTRAWIDFNNDGIFNNTTELVMDVSNAFNPTVSVAILGGAVLNVPLRMRISSDIVGAAQSACDANNFGQTEDYGIIIQPNTLPPVANFAASITSTCTDTVCFTDQSLNVATGWLWDFGDGITSTSQNPCHFYSVDGVYTVSLLVTNAFGQDSTMFNNYININCSNINMPITGVITSTECSGTLFDDGGNNSDYSNNTDGIVVIQPLGATSISLNFLSFNFENNWDFLNIYDGPSTASTPLGSFTGTNLPSTILSSGGSITIEQVTDGTVREAGFELTWLCSTSLLPVANFIAPITSTCSDTVCFTDLSVGAPNSWLWDFGDGTTSTSQNPCHFYTVDGVYTVSLLVTNAFGQDTTTFSNYINIDCSNINMPTTGVVTTDECSGTLFDDGGASSNHSNNTDGSVVIQPTGATQVSLNFIAFDFVTSFPGDTLFIYDGPSILSPLIVFFIGNATPGIINSTGPSITIRQKTNNFITDPGFELTWSCLTTGVEETKINPNQFLVYPNPTNKFINIETVNTQNVIKEIRLFNVVGKRILEKQFSSSNTFTQINVSHLPKGLYFLNILNDEGLVTKKINIQ